MESILKEVTETVEAAPALPPVEPQGGFPWTGAGLGVLVIVVAAGLYKNYCRCKK